MTDLSREEMINIILEMPNSELQKHVARSIGMGLKQNIWHRRREWPLSNDVIKDMVDFTKTLTLSANPYLTDELNDFIKQCKVVEEFGPGTSVGDIECTDEFIKFCDGELTIQVIDKERLNSLDFIWLRLFTEIFGINLRKKLGRECSTC